MSIHAKPYSGPRFIILDNDFQVIRDMTKGDNYHLESSLEALALREHLNSQIETIALLLVQIDNLKQEVAETEALRVTSGEI